MKVGNSTADSVAAFRFSSRCALRLDSPFSGKHDRPVALSEIATRHHRLAINVSTANDLFGLAQRAGQLFHRSGNIVV